MFFFFFLDNSRTHTGFRDKLLHHCLRAGSLKSLSLSLSILTQTTWTAQWCHWCCYATSLKWPIRLQQAIFRWIWYKWARSWGVMVYGICTSEGVYVIPRANLHISPSFYTFLPISCLFLLKRFFLSPLILSGCISRWSRSNESYNANHKSWKDWGALIHLIFGKEYIMSKENLDLSNFTLKEKGANCMYLHVHVKQVDYRRHGDFWGNLIFVVTHNHEN